MYFAHGAAASRGCLRSRRQIQDAAASALRLLTQQLLATVVAQALAEIFLAGVDEMLQVYARGRTGDARVSDAAHAHAHARQTRHVHCLSTLYTR